MSKKKRSKILATLLCATTMAAFYASPQIGYAVSLNQKEDGTVTTDSGGTNTAIHNIEGIESITFGVQGDMETGGVNLYFDGKGTYGGLVANGSLTATDLYITVENNADGDNYNSNKYSLKNALGIHRTGTGDKAITNIEANSLGHGGMQVSSDTVSILDGAAVFTNKTTSDNGGTISFSSAFNSEQGMTVGTNFVLDSTGKISKVNGIDVQGALTTTGTINSMTIRNNQVNGVTMLNSNVTANTITGTDITDGTYHLSQIGSILSDVEEIDDKTEGIAGYDAMTGTTFTGNVRASGGLVTGTGTISDTNSHSFTVEQAQNVITSVNDSTSGLAATNTLANRNRTDIDGLTERVGTAEGHITTLTGNVTDLTGKVTTAEGEIDTLQTATTGMSYNDGSGTTFAQNVTANDFKIAGGTSLSQVASELTTAQGNIQTNTNNITTLTGRVTTAESEIGTLKSTTADHESRITANTNNITTLTGKVTTAEGEIDTLQTTVGEHDTAISGLSTRVDNAETDITVLETKTQNISTDGNSITNLTNLSTANLTATTGTIGSVTFTGGTATGLTNIAGASVTVAGTAIGNGSFNGVTIADYNTNDSHGATINSVSIYKDSSNDYWVGNVNISDLTSGSGVTIEGIKRTDNGTEGHITTIEENLAINSNGEISNHNDSFKVDVDGTVTGKDFAIDSNTSLSGVAGDLDTAEGKITKNETAISGLGTRVTTAESEIGTLKSTTADHESRITANTSNITALTGRVTTAEGEIDTLQTTTTGMNYNSGTGTTFNQVVNATDFKAGDITLTGVAGDLDTAEGRINANETAINGLGTRVATAETDITGLKNKTHGFDPTGETLELTTINSTTGTVGGVTFNGGTATGLNTIGTAADTVTVAGTAISNGSFNGVNIGVDSDSHATFNGVSIYKDANDYIVGDVNISALKGVSGTEIKGIKRTSNNGGGFTTTIEENLAVSTDGTIKQTNGDFAVDTDGNVTGKDFKVNGTSLGDVASAVNDQTKGLKATYDIASANQAAITDEETGLGALNNKTTGMTYTAGTTTADGITEFDHKLKATAFETENLTATEGNIGGISFETVNGVKTIGTDSDTITLAGNAISKGSFNGVSIGVDGSNRATFNGVSIYTDSANENDVMVGGINISDLQSGSAEITNKLRGITYSNESGNDYTMTFAGVMSVSTEGEYKFKYNGNEYGLDDLINTVSSEDLAGFEELKKKVDKLEDKTTGIEFDEGTGSTTINDMDKDSSGNWVKGDNSLTVGDDGITANGDTVINGDTDDNTTGGNGNDSNDPQGGDSIINGDQLVNGDQHVTGDSQFDGTITVGSGTDDKGQTVIDGGNITTGDTIIDGGSVTSKEGHFDNINVGSGENATTIGESGIQVGDNTTIDNSGVSIKDENGSVVMGDHDVVIKDSDGNVEASLSDVANRVDGIEQSIGDLNSRMGELEDRIDKVGAMAAAIANLRTMGYDPAAPTEVAVGIGQYRNETGAALGLFHYPNRDFMLSLSVSTSGDEVMGGIGATWKFGRKSPEKVAAEKAEKAREAKLQKAEAIKEAARLKKIEAQQERHAKLAAQKTATK